MKITLAEFERTGGAPPLEMFTQGIKAEETREKYTRTLRRVLCNVFEEILEGTFEERAAQLVRHGREHPDWVRDLLLNLSKKLRARTELARSDPDYFNPSSIANYFKPIKKLLDMNDVAMPWARIYATFPEQDNVPDSRGWTRAEISRMLRFAAGTTDRALVLLAASSGIRMGGFDLDWGDMKPVYRDGDKLSFEGTGEPVCAMLSIYRGTSSQYPAFVTPEACRALADHRESWARETGRQPEPSDPMFKKHGPLARRATQDNTEIRVTPAGWLDTAGMDAAPYSPYHQHIFNRAHEINVDVFVDALDGQTTWFRENEEWDSEWRSEVRWRNSFFEDENVWFLEDGEVTFASK